MAEILTIAEKLSGVSLFTMMIILVYLGATKRWAWGRELIECETRCAQQLAAAERRIEAAEKRTEAAEKRTKEWQEITLNVLQASKEIVQVVKERRG